MNTTFLNGAGFVLIIAGFFMALTNDDFTKQAGITFSVGGLVLIAIAISVILGGKP